MATEPRPKLLITGDFDIPSEMEVRIRDRYVVSHLRNLSGYADLSSELANTSSYILGGPEYLDQEMLRRAKELRQIVVMGTGSPSFLDLEYARSQGIRVDNTPHLNVEAVAEFVLGSLITHSVPMVHSINEVRYGQSWPQPVRKGLRESTIGIIGMGHIGAKVAELLKLVAPTATIYYWNRNRKQAVEDSLGISFKDLKTLFTKSDLLTIHIACCQETHGLVDSALLDCTSDTTRLFNFSNPNIVDALALRDWLLGRDSTFALFDGYYREWVSNSGMSSDNEGLLGLPASRFVAMSHLSALESSTLERILLAAEKELILSDLS